MKLYTEYQVKKMLEVCRDSDLYEHILTFEGILKTETPIELPSDEEISKEADSFFALESYNQTFTRGAKWMRDKIQGENDKQ